MMLTIDHIDHLVLTVADLDRTTDFYTNILGMRTVHFDDGRVALRFGDEKINLHLHGHEIDPKAAKPTPGAADLCLIVNGGFNQVEETLKRHHVAYVGPVQRQGALGPITSVYLRDPDQNLIELSTYKQE